MGFLPDSDITTDVTVHPQAGVPVTFRCRTIPAEFYWRIFDACKTGDADPMVRDMAIPLLVAGIEAWTDDHGDTWQPFGPPLDVLIETFDPDSEEYGWPEFGDGYPATVAATELLAGYSVGASDEVLFTVHNLNRAADPKVRSIRNGPHGPPTAADTGEPE